MSDDFLPPIVAVLTANIKEFQGKMAEATETSKVETEEMSGHAKKFSMAAVAGFTAAGAAAFEIGKSVFETTEKFESAHVRLDQIVKNTGLNVDGFNKTLKAQEGHYANLAIDSTSYESALAVLVAATGNAKKAETDMAEAADLAAAKHMDLESAAKLVGKVAAGNTTVLKRYGIDLGIAGGGVQAVKAAQEALIKANLAYTKVQDSIHAGTIKGATAANALQVAQLNLTNAQQKLNNAQTAGDQGITALAKKFGGSASAQTETLGGKMAVLKAKVHNVEIEIGEKLNGALDTLGKWLTGPQGTKAVDLFKASWDGFSGMLDTSVVPAVDNVTTKMADWLDTITTKAANLVNTLTTDLANAINSITSGSINSMFGAHGTGAATSPAEAKQMADNYDRSQGLPVGTTWKKEQGGNVTGTGHGKNTPAHGKGKAMGGTESYPVAGALEVLHGTETILPHSDPGRARMLYKQSGLGDSSDGGVHVHGDVKVTVVSPDPAKAGEAVRQVFTDATFLRGRT